MYGAAANSAPDDGSSRTMSVFICSFGSEIEVSIIRSRAVKICCAVGCVGDVHDEALKPAVEDVIGGIW